MKKLLIPCMIVALLATFLIPQPAAAAEGTPVDIALTCAGGAANTGSAAYTTGFATAANSALRPLAVSWAIAGVAATNGTLTLRKAAGGPVWATIALGNTTATSTNYVGVSLITSEWYWRRSDTLHVTLSVTNAAAITLHGLER